MIVIRTGIGMSGCAPLTNEERLQAYALRLCGHYNAHDHARRAAEGLERLKALRKLWRKKRKAKASKPQAKPSNVVTLRAKRRA